jgi:hypothetical protein
MLSAVSMFFVETESPPKADAPLAQKHVRRRTGFAFASLRSVALSLTGNFIMGKLVI